MKIAIEGCAHGELERIYDSVAHIEKQEEVKVDLLICCGDFQSTRNLDDLKCMAIPQKFHNMCSFYKYYSGEKIAPILTIFIGGNHEASNYLQELSYGGWVAPNIYYLGNAGVINIAGIRIAGISGIYKGHDFNKGHHELPPYNDNTKRSVYHIRNLEIYRLKQLTGHIDIFLSHDWPRGIYNHGDAGQLLRHKPFFKEDVESNKLGSPPCEDLLHHLKPSYWFSAHLHTKFAARVIHDNDNEINGKLSDTKFLALDKCLPQRRFLQILEVEHDAQKDIAIEYDLEWLAILHLTNHLMSVKEATNYMPGKGSPQRWIFTPTAAERELVYNKLSRNLKVPLNFTQTATPYSPQSPIKSKHQPRAQVNAQTLGLCNALNIDDPVALLLMYNKKPTTDYRINGSAYDTNSSCTDISTDHVSFSSFENSNSKSTKDEDVQNKVQRISLVLPTPKTENEEQILIDETVEVNNETKDIVDNAVLKNKVQRISLNLPSPKSITSVNEAIEPIILNKDLDTVNSMKVEDGHDKNEGNCLKTDLTSSPVINSAKKFKRRNQEMYTSVSDNAG